jgi:hypothetical protein
MDNLIYQSPLVVNSQLPTVEKVVTDDTTITRYVGFAAMGAAGIYSPRFSVLRITENGDTGVTMYEWANGTQARMLPFAGCEDYEYSFLK